MTTEYAKSKTIQSQPEFKPWPKSFGQNNNLFIATLIYQGFLNHCQSF